MEEILTKSAGETFALGEKTAGTLKAGDVIALSGDLGVGKTVFSQGIASGLGIGEIVCSPTFTILQEYHSGRLPLYHYDVYRLGDPSEMEEIGYLDYFYGDGVCLVEWAEQIEELLPETCIRVTIEKLPGEGDDLRRIRIERSGKAEETN